MRTAAAGGLGNIFGDDSIFTPSAVVTHGVHREIVPANQSVRQIRAGMGDRLGLNGRVSAYLDGREVSDDVRVRHGQTLTFMRKAGEKGVPAHGLHRPDRG
ncbi:MAG: hypothetical protein ACYS0G_11765 [Planctomycetota bacterium]